MSRAPKPVREPAGSVKPPMTNSWPRPHLSFSQAVDRPASYGPSARLVQQFPAARVAVCGEAQRRPVGEGPAQQGLARPQGERGHIGAVEPQQIERVVRDGHPRGADPARVGEAHALLEPGEVRTAGGVEGDHLAVNGEVGALLGREGGDDLRIRGVQLPAAARQQPDAVAVPDGEQPDAVEFAFEDPAVPEVPQITECGQHGPGRQLCAGPGGPHLPELTGRKRFQQALHRPCSFLLVMRA
jgi:hypothetical protein